MIEAKNLCKTYKPKRGVPVKALDDVSVKLPSTGMIFILGKSGSGKSTLLNVLGGLDSFDSGEILINGASTKKFKQSHYDSYRNTYVGFIFQEYNILDEFTVGANVALAIELQGRKATDEEINEILGKVELLGYANRKPNELSGGQKQRVAIARALVKKPEIIMADEPTGALDSATGKQVFDTLKQLSKEKLVIIVSHDRDFAEQYADRIIELADGKIISDAEIAKDFDEAAMNEPPLTYAGDEIRIKMGYTLTEQDRIDINNYIANLKSDVTLKTSKNSNGGIASGKKFVPTDESAIKETGGIFKLIKSKLSIKNSFKIGASGLKYKKIRLAVTILLSFIAFTLFGVADTIASYNKINTEVKSLTDSQIDYASFVKAKKESYGDGYGYWRVGYRNGVYVSDSDIKKLNEKTGMEFSAVYFNSDSYELSLIRNIKTYLKDSDADNTGVKSDEYEKLSLYFPQKLVGFSEITEKKLQEFGYTLNGTIPDGSKKEIAIPKYVYELFVKTGLYHYDTAKYTKISDESDIIGEKISLGEEYYTVTAVVDTGFDWKRYETLAKSSDNAAEQIIQMALANELAYAQNYSLHCVAFVGEGFINDAIKNGGARFDYLYNKSIMYANDQNKLFESANAITSVKSVLDSVAWANAPKKDLGDGEFVITLVSAENIISGNAAYLSERAQKLAISAEDREFIDVLSRYGYPVEYNIASLISYSSVIANYKFAKDTANIDSVKQELRKSGMLNDEMTEDEIVKCFITLENKNSRKRAREYDTGIESRYGLKGYFLTDEIWNYMFPQFEYNGTVYDFYEYTGNIYMLSDIADFKDFMSNIAYKYSSENIEKALEYNASQGLSAGVMDAIYNYSWYLCGGEGPGDFRKYALSEYIKIFKNAGYFDNMRYCIAENYSSDGAEKKEMSVAGIVDSYDWALVVSDDMYKTLVGEQEKAYYAFAVAPMPKNAPDIKSIVQISNDETDNIGYRLMNAVTYELDLVSNVLDVMGKIFLYVGIGFALFASLMLSNFIATSISLKKREIGILRAIGSRSNDVFKIFFAEAFIIAMINYVLALAGTITVTIIINNVLRTDIGILVTILTFGVRQIAVLLAISVLVALIATFLPVKKIASKKPIDAIRDK